MADPNPKEQPQTGNKPESRPTDWSTVLSEMRERLAEMKKTTDEYRALTEKNQEAAAMTMLGGRTDSAEQVQEKKELTPKEYTEKVMSGEVPKE